MNKLVKFDNAKEVSNFDAAAQDDDNKIVKTVIFDGQAAQDERERRNKEMEKIFGKQNWRSM